MLKTPLSFSFTDLFAGIGGLCVGFEAVGGTCVFISEWNRFSQETYAANLGDHHPLNVRYHGNSAVKDPSSGSPAFNLKHRFILE